jgi:ketosteroid isomerase-like protein
VVTVSSTGAGVVGVGAGAVLGLGVRALLPRLLRMRFERDVRRLNDGDRSALLSAYADDAVLRFHEGEHRWSGQWVGKPAIDRFLQQFVASRVQGEIRQMALSGPPWALTIWVRFDDHADGPDGTRLYENSTVLILRTRWGKVVEQHDFYANTERITSFDRALARLGVDPVPKPSLTTSSPPSGGSGL